MRIFVKFDRNIENTDRWKRSLPVIDNASYEFYKSIYESEIKYIQAEASIYDIESPIKIEYSGFMVVINKEDKVKSKFEEFESSKQLDQILNNICELSSDNNYYADLGIAIAADENCLNYSHSEIKSLYLKYLNTHKKYFTATLEYFDFALNFYQNYIHYHDNDWRKIKIDYHNEQQRDIEKAFEKDELTVIINKIDNIIDFLIRSGG